MPSRPYSVLFSSWIIAGAGAVVGSIIGNAFGYRGLLAGAVVGGVIGVLVAVGVATRLGWLDLPEQRGALWGGVIAFLIAVPVAVLNLDSPVTPVLSCGLVGIGTLIGAGVTRSS